MFAQAALRRLSISSPADAAGLLAAVKDGTLAGIYKEDEQVPALRALKHGLTWWTLVPAGEDAALVLDPAAPVAGPPLIAFRDRVRSSAAQLDPALLRAWRSFQGLRSGTVVVCPPATGSVTAEVGAGQPLPNVVPPILCVTRPADMVRVRAPQIRPGLAGIVLPDAPIGVGPVPPFDLALIKRWILAKRVAHNTNNPSRTNFYLHFWELHKEIAWTLLAHLVSRNAGYQMSDLARYRLVASGPGIPASGSLPSVLFADLFGYLEAGNFLIFRDVFPQLATYAWAKRLLDQTGLDHSAAIFGLLRDPEFDVDPLIVNEWQRFFAAARGRSPRWWDGVANPALEAPVIRLSLFLIANEQNHIEKRLVHPVSPATGYLGILHTPITTILRALARFRLTVIAFPAADRATGTTAISLLLHDVPDFSILDARIETGRQLYTGLFLVPPRPGTVIRWASAPANRLHHGTRVDYDALNYDLSPLSLVPSGKTYSPPLVSGLGVAPPWPERPGDKNTGFERFHRVPPSLPPWSSVVPAGQLASWLRPPRTDAFRPPGGEEVLITAGRPLSEIAF